MSSRKNTVCKNVPDEQARHLGYTPGPNDGSFEEQESAAKANLKALMTMRTLAVAYPNSFDLRNVCGSNFITSVKDQGGCGSCVAFGTIAVVKELLEKSVMIQTSVLITSEAHLFYCHARSEGRRCSGPQGGGGQSLPKQVQRHWRNG